MKKLLLLLLILSFSLVPSFVFATQEYSSSFDSSSSQYLSITDANQTGLNITGDISGEAWIFLSNLGVQRVIFSRYNGSVRLQYDFQILDNNKLWFGFYSNNTTASWATTDSAITVNTNEWHHVAFTADISVPEIKFYLNGQLVNSTMGASNSTTIQSGTNDFIIGAYKSSGNPTGFFNGKLDEVRVWNDIRTATEISDNYNTTLVGNEAGLVGYWKMENNFLDETSNNNDLTNNNSVTFSSDVPFTLTPEPEEPIATSTPIQFSFVPDDLDYIDDIGVIVGLTYHYETSTTTADWYEKHYFRWVGIYMILFIFLFFMIANRLLLELIIRWRK